MDVSPKKAMSTLTILETPRLSLWSVLRWIHLDVPEDQFSRFVRERIAHLHQQPQLLPIEVVTQAGRVAAAYFIQLPGQVGTLGGLRCRPGCESMAAMAVQALRRRQEELGIQQLQAIVDPEDTTAWKALSQAGFVRVTEVLQICKALAARPLPRLFREHELQSSSEPEVASRLHWRPARSLSFEQMAALIEQTFDRSLDCPLLHGIRSVEENLCGFLDGYTWADWSNGELEHLDWWVLCCQQVPIGCTLLKHHPGSVTELVYMGLAESQRGHGLGKELLRKSIEAANARGHEYLTSAVDSQNWPAVQLYEQFGFERLKRLTVWLPDRLAIRLAA